MLFKRNSREDDSLLQNQFTAYISRAIKNRRIDYLNAQHNHWNHEICVDFFTFQEDYAEEHMTLAHTEEELLPSSNGFENEALERALLSLSDRERHVLLARILSKCSYQELGEEYGIGYKGIASIYTRASKKVKDEMEGEK